MITSLFLVALVAFVAGAIASVSGFGIGSLLTPLVALQTGMKLAVPAVSIPHITGTAVRFWRLRSSVDRRVLVSFGIPSAMGGLIGALLHTYADSPVLSVALGLLLLFAGVIELFGLADRIRIPSRWAWIAGAASGGFGGLVGNQGGVRSAALLGFGLQKKAFVATATAVALIVDSVRMPIYFASHRDKLVDHWMQIAVAVVGVVLGTFVGHQLLDRIPEQKFRRVVGALILVLGVVVLFGVRRT